MSLRPSDLRRDALTIGLYYRTADGKAKAMITTGSYRLYAWEAGGDVFYPGFKNCSYGTLEFIPGLHENVSTRDDFTGDNLQSQHNIVPAKWDGAFI